MKHRKSKMKKYKTIIIAMFLITVLGCAENPETRTYNKTVKFYPNNSPVQTYKNVYVPFWGDTETHIVFYDQNNKKYKLSGKYSVN